MNDADLVALWAELGPDVRRRARIEARVFEWLEASETSLVGEWLALLRVEPLTGLGLAAVGAGAVVFLTPVGWLAALLLS